MRAGVVTTGSTTAFCRAVCDATTPATACRTRASEYVAAGQGQLRAMGL